MTINRYFFNYRDTNFVIFAKDISEAFEPYQRILFHKAGTEKDFQDNLLLEHPEIQNCLVLCGRSVSRDMLNDILKPYQKSPIPAPKPVREYKGAPKEIADALKDSIPVSEEIALGPIVKRGRGRPKGSTKNKQEISETKLDSFFE